MGEAPAAEPPPAAAERRFSNPVLTRPRKGSRKRKRRRPRADPPPQAAAAAPSAPPQPTRPPLFGQAKLPPALTDEKVRRKTRPSYADLQGYEREVLPEKGSKTTGETRYPSAIEL